MEVCERWDVAQGLPYILPIEHCSRASAAVRRDGLYRGARPPFVGCLPRDYQIMSSRTLWAVFLLCLVGSWAVLMIMAIAGLNVFADGRVGGRVTFNGKPMTGGLVVFSPVRSGQGEGTSALIKRDGHYTVDRSWRKTEGQPTRYEICVYSPRGASRALTVSTDLRNGHLGYAPGLRQGIGPRPLEELDPCRLWVRPARDVGPAGHGGPGCDRDRYRRESLTDGGRSIDSGA